MLQPGAGECGGFIAQQDGTVRALLLQHPASYHGGFFLFMKVHLFLKVTHLESLKESPTGHGTCFLLEEPPGCFEGQFPDNCPAVLPDGARIDRDGLLRLKRTQYSTTEPFLPSSQR
jgi:hypothetical protein